MSEIKKFRKGKHEYTKWGSTIKEVKTMPEQNVQKPVELQIEADEVTAQGIYSNLAFITHSDSEFVLDFIFVQPQQPKAKLRARIISSPAHTKKLLAALADNVKKYEERFGEIKLHDTPNPKVGFGNA